MPLTFVHHRVTCQPRTWLNVAKQVIGLNDFMLKDNDTALYGLWRSQIGLPRDTITIISVWLDLETAKEKSDQIFLKSLKNLENKFTWKETYLNILKLSEELSSFIENKDRCLLISENRPEWMISDLAIMLSKAVSYTHLTLPTNREV